MYICIGLVLNLPPENKPWNVVRNYKNEKMKNNVILILIISTIICSCSVNVDNELNELLGKEINSESIQSFLNKLDATPEITRFDDVYYYTYLSKGVDLRFSSKDSLEAIFLFSESADNHRQFQGKIPFDIELNSTRFEVEKKLGPPESNDGGGYINFYSSWNNKGITVSYKTSNQEDMNNKVHHIVLQQVKK